MRKMVEVKFGSINGPLRFLGENLPLYRRHIYNKTTKDTCAVSNHKHIYFPRENCFYINTHILTVARQCCGRHTRKINKKEKK